MSIANRIERLEQAIGRRARYRGLDEATLEVVLDLFRGNRTFGQLRRAAWLAKQFGDTEETARRDAESNRYAYNLVADRLGADVADRFFGK